MFKDTVCDYTLGNITYDEIIDGAQKSIDEGESSDALFVLAGIQKKTTDYYDVIRYYKNAIDELKIGSVTVKEAAIHITKNLCAEYINGNIEYYKFLLAIRLRVYNHTLGKLNDTKYVGDSIGIQNFMGLYWEIEDYYIEEMEKGEDRKKELEEEIEGLCKKYANEYLDTEIDLTTAST